MWRFRFPLFSFSLCICTFRVEFFVISGGTSWKIPYPLISQLIDWWDFLILGSPIESDTLLILFATYAPDQLAAQKRLPNDGDVDPFGPVFPFEVPFLPRVRISFSTCTRAPLSLTLLLLHRIMDGAALWSPYNRWSLCPGNLSIWGRWHQRTPWEY